MLKTLLKIGEWKSQGKSKWDRFLDYPELEYEDKRGNSIKNYTLPIIFDLDEEKVIISQDNLEEYDEEVVQDILPIKLKGRRSKKIATALPGNKLNQFYNTFFGKEGGEIKSGELFEAMENDNPNSLTNEFKLLLSEIYKLKDQFLKLTTNLDNKKVDIRSINESFELSKNEKIVFIYAQIKSTGLGFDKPISFSEIPSYFSFLEKLYFENEEFRTNNLNLCYASGEIEENVKGLDLSERYSLNKMFVTETKNYASLFEEKRFPLNYQVSAKNQNYLDYASDYLLNKGYTIRIAGVSHIILPEFQTHSEIDLEMALIGINRKSDLLFNINRLGNLSVDISDELKENEIYWLNFMAYESDGNFFKTTEKIKDISNFHFNKIIDAFYTTDKKFKELSYVDWSGIMTEYDFESKDRKRFYLNFNSLFKIIPLRKDKEKKNKALELFKTILENRKVQREQLYDYFTELILCHYYSRYTSYNNVRDFSQKGKQSPAEYFVWASRDAVFKYHAFIQFLKTLNLIDMEETNLQPKQKSENKYDKAILDFFNEMTFTKEQKAMFYLGRMLNTVEYLQQGKNMTVIQKVNFNGMDKDSIQRLRTGLMEKAKQYREVHKLIFTDNKFGQYFDYNNWNMSPNEAIFFLLTGYSFGVGVKKEEIE